MNSKQTSDISVVIHSYNSADQIEECVKSAVLLTDKIYIVDMESDDKTAEIATAAGAQVFKVSRHPYVEPVREYGIRLVKTSWVFLLDTDERMTLELAKEIRETIANADDEIGCYKVPRKNIFARKQWLQHGGWWPDYQTRLINIEKFKIWPKAIHSTPVIDGSVRLLSYPLLHYFHGDIESMVKKTVIFEDMESDLLFNAGRTVSTATFFRKFFGELYRRLILKRGFLDGGIGIIESIYQAYSKTITYLYLYEKKKSRAV